MDAIPSDVGDRLLDTKSTGTSFENTKPFYTGSLFTLFKQGMQTQTDTQKRSIALQVGFQGIHILLLTQYMDHISKTAHTGKYQFFGRKNFLAVLGNPDGFADFFYGVDNASHVTSAIV